MRLLRKTIIYPEFAQPGAEGHGSERRDRGAFRPCSRRHPEGCIDERDPSTSLRHKMVRFSRMTSESLETGEAVDLLAIRAELVDGGVGVGVAEGHPTIDHLVVGKFEVEVESLPNQGP